MPNGNSVVAVFATHSEAEQARRELEHRGISSEALSIIGKCYHSDERPADLNAHGAGLYDIGISEKSIMKYQTAIKADRFLLVAHGAPVEVVRASGILEGAQPLVLTLHAAEFEAAEAVA